MGRDCVRRSARHIGSFGDRAAIITSRFAPGCENLALQDMLSVLTEEGKAVLVTDCVEENPSVESVAAITETLRDFDPHFLIAIGGGSALDTAKAANVLLGSSGHADPYEVFYSGEVKGTGCMSEGVLPLLGIPTTAGSGSEVAGYAVLTRNDLHTKLRINQLSFFSEAFLDARYIRDSPRWLLDNGALDALAHGIEGYVNVASNPMNRLMSDYAFRLFASFKDRLLTCTLTEADCEDMLLAAAIQGISVMQSSTTLPHAMGYPLTHHKGICHGLASCVTLGAYLELLWDKKTVGHILRQCGFDSVDGLRDYLWQVIDRNVTLTVTDEELRRWSRELFENKQRLARHPQPITEQEIYGLYRQSLAICLADGNHTKIR